MNSSAPSTSEAEGICRILEVSKAAGVTFLRFGELEVHFADHVPEKHMASPLPVRPESLEQEIEKATQDALDMEIEDAEEERLGELNLTDPVEFEKRKLEGYLGGKHRAEGT